jgi:hypothetical protein
MKKIGLLSLAVILALGTLGVGYAMWSDTVLITGTASTGDLDVAFSNQMSNDASSGTDLSSGDPAAVGTWTTPDLEDPSGWTWTGAVQPEGAEKETASIDCLIDDDTLTVTIDHGYPCYFGGIGFTIDNLGSVPVKILSMKLISVNNNSLRGSLVGADGYVDLTADTQYYVNVGPAGPASHLPIVETTPDAAGDDTDDFSIVLTDLAVGDQIGQAGSNTEPDELFGDIHVHIEQGIPQGLGCNGNRPFTFTIEIVCAQWNEVDVECPTPSPTP